jgi:hypothetical protein
MKKGARILMEDEPLILEKMTKEEKDRFIDNLGPIMEKMVPEKKKSTDRLDAIIDARAGLIEELAKRHNMSESNIRELIGGL